MIDSTRKAGSIRSKCLYSSRIVSVARSTKFEHVVGLYSRPYKTDELPRNKHAMVFDRFLDLFDVIFENGPQVS